MQELVLHSPAHGDPCIFYWPMDDKARGEGAVEVIETIKWVCDDFPEMKLALDNHILSGCDLTSYESMKVVCDRYNRVIASVRQMRAGTSLTVAVPTRPSQGLLRHIIQKAYNHAVLDPDKLNNYEPFSPEVYGETSFEFISQMINQIPITENDVFIDLGSGVGQVVLQIAASTKAKRCIGIEKAEVPAMYAQELERSFKFWMRWYGKVSGDYELVRGDFFDEKFKETITNASFIFVNNFAFGPNVDHMLKLRFADLKDGARIVSSKSFCPSNFRITDRNLSDIATIMHVREIQPNIKGSVSWTGKPVSYYHHIIDRRKLEDYFLNMRGPKKNMNRNQPNNKDNINANGNNNANANNASGNHHVKDSDESNRRAIKSHCNDSSSSDESADIKDENYFGPTTRKAWSEYCNAKYRENSNSNSNHSSNGNTQLSSFSETGYHSSSQVKPNTANGPNRPGRPRKYAPGVSAVVRRATKNKTNPEGRRRPGRPRKDSMRLKKNKRVVNFNGLDLLHAQTVLSISNSAGVKTEPAPGCIDQKLDSVKRPEVPPQSFITVNHGLGFGSINHTIIDAVKNIEMNNCDIKPQEESLNPVAPISLPEGIKEQHGKLTAADLELEESENKPLNDVNSPQWNILMESISSSLDDLFDDYKRQFMSFILHMQTRTYKNDLIAEIDQEKRKHSNYLSQVEILERTVTGLREKGVNLLKSRLSELNIAASTSEELVTRAREIICLNKDLQEQAHTYQEQVNYLENLNNALKKHKSYDNLMHMNVIKTSKNESMSSNLVNGDKSVETANQKMNNVTATEKVHQNPFLVKDVVNPLTQQPKQQELHQHVQPQLQTQQVQQNRVQSQPSVGPCRLINIEERMRKVIVAALNDNKESKKESRKRSKTSNDNKVAKTVPRCDGIYDFDDDEPPNLKPETDYPSRLKDASKLGPIKDVSISFSTTGQSTKGSESRSSTNKTLNSTSNPPTEDKKPILLTFKIDRRDNSAIVTSPCISPEKSPSKVSKDLDASTKKKHFSPERVRKSRSPKYSSIVPETNGTEKRASLIIKLNHSSTHQTNHQEKSEANFNHSNARNDKPLDASNKSFLTSSSSTSRSHHDPPNGTHKWQATISNSFDKLVKLAHQLDPPKEEVPSTMVVEKSILKATLKRKRSQKPLEGPKTSKTSAYTFAEESVSTKTPPDTPPDTPSPSDSLERPLTPQTPPGLTLASDEMISKNQTIRGANGFRSSPPSSINYRSDKTEATNGTMPMDNNLHSSPYDPMVKNLKVRKVGRPPKKSIWHNLVDSTNNSVMVNSALSSTNFVNHGDVGSNETSPIKSTSNHETMHNHHSINHSQVRTNSIMDTQPTSSLQQLQQYQQQHHQQQSLFNHQFMQPDKTLDLQVNKSNQNLMKHSTPLNGEYSPLSVPISSIAQHPPPSGFGPSSIDFPPQAFYPSFPPPPDNSFTNKLYRKLSSDESSPSAPPLSKCYSQKKVLRPSRLDGMCKRDYNTAIKQFT